MRFFLLTIVLFFSINLFSQSSNIIFGEIRNSNNNDPLSDVYVYIEKLNIGTLSNGKGDFKLNDVPFGTYKIIASSIGFSTISHQITVTKDTFEGIILEMTETLYDLPNVLIESISLTGGYSGIEDIHGSAHYISKKELTKFNHSDINRILRSVPGIQIQEEDGFGLRPNIGIRGTSTERSSKITLMEDGVLIAPAPYASPSAYYFPTIGRMEGVEILKGSSQIKHGPYTTGGALNLLSKRIPLRSEGIFDISAGSYYNRKIEASYGQRVNNLGFLVQGFNYGSSGFKKLKSNDDTGFNKTDFLVKFGMNSGNKVGVYHSFKLKLGYTKERSNETYLGLSEGDFNIEPLQRYSASQVDQMNSKHNSYSASYTVEFSPIFQMNTTAYYNYFHRNWYKLDKVSNGDGSKIGISSILKDTTEYFRAYGIIKGEDSQNDHLYVKANNRSYKSTGIQSIAHIFLGRQSKKQKLNLGIRYHYDEMDRFQWVDEYTQEAGRMKVFEQGQEGTESNRIISANAIAAFARLDLKWNKISINPGLRIESMILKRMDFGKEDPDRIGTNLSERENKETVLIPGISFNYHANNSFSLFGGLHRGFSPPGTQEEALPESSINYEIGSKINKGSLRGQMVVFYTDYSNLLGSDVNAGGGSGNDELFNGGEADIKGIEAQVKYIFNNFLSTTVQMPVSIKYSYSDARFRSSFESELEIWKEVNAGDLFPYLAKHQISTLFALEHRKFGFHVQMNYHSPMLTKSGSLSQNEIFVMDEGFNIDMGFDINIKKNITTYASIINLSNNISRIAMHPAGLRPSTPRTIMLGLRVEL